MIIRHAGFGDGLDLQLPGRPAGFFGMMDASQQQRRDMDAAADLMGPGAIATPMFQAEILDLVRKRGVFGQRVRRVPATGHPTRYFEQTRIVSGVFQNPRQLSYQPNNDPTRRERFASIKAIYGSIQFGLFDVEVTRQQGQFTYLVAKDVNDTIEGCLRTSDYAIWNGSDTSLLPPLTQEYVGARYQINRTAAIASSASIIDGLKAEIAALVANPDFVVRPSAVYINPLLGDLIDQEERLNQRQIPQTVLNTVTGGLQVQALSTQAGLIPLIPDPLLLNGPTGGSATESGKTDYTAYILMEELVEMHYVTTPNPRVFQLGLGGGLATQYAVVLFDAPIFKGSANASQDQSVVESSITTYAHSRVTITK